jgi:hypothetical protein
MAQKVDLDTLDIDQLNLCKHKAVKMRKAGIILTFSGVGILATGGITTIIKQKNVRDPYDNMASLIPGHEYDIFISRSKF